jgi:hypothetical protein
MLKISDLQRMNASNKSEEEEEVLAEKSEATTDDADSTHDNQHRHDETRPIGNTVQY